MTLRHTFEQQEDGGSISQFTYQLRGLSDEDEVTIWTNFCASVFSYKTNAPTAAYFARHYHHDPYRHGPAYIRVAICSVTQEIVASVRIFPRTISVTESSQNRKDVNSSTASIRQVKAGGIGEVCTDSRHRRRRLSAELLKDALMIMEHDKFALSFLHAAPEFFAVYQKFDYQCSATKWSIVRVIRDDCFSLQEQLCRIVVRPVNWSTDVPQLTRIHHKYSEQRYAGCIHRSLQYWEEYLQSEIPDMMVAVDSDNDQKVVGWMSLQSKGGRVRVREFGADRLNGPSVHSLFAALLKSCGSIMPADLRAISSASLDPDFLWTNAVFHLVVPTVLYDELHNDYESRAMTTCYLRWEATIRDDDHGWMYRLLGKDNAVDMRTTDSLSPHFIWPSDSF
jgi:predicted GNAT family N-acyltransferase